MRACLESIPDDIKRLFVAYSGGLDSSVLLHLLLSDERNFQIIPWHINHGLIESAEQMEQFCVEQATSYDLEIRLDHLDLSDTDSNIEASARHLRYQLFEQHSGCGDCIVTAHHADDQAETFILNALRGSGVAGLRGIAQQRYLGETLLIRPLLGYSRAQLEAYAVEHEIAWFNDASNQSIRFDRNYLRHEVLPRVKKRWPNFHKALSTSSQIQSETQALLSEVAQQDYAKLKIQGPGDEVRLDLPGLLALSDGRCKNLIRYWIDLAGQTALPYTRLQELMQQLWARADALPEIAMPGYSIRIYDQQLFLLPDNDQQDCGGEFDFGLKQEIEIDQLDLRLTRAEVFKRLNIEDQAQSLALRFRLDGESNRDGHRLKRLFQQHRVPPWQRAATAQVYLDGRLEGLLL